MSRFPRTVVVVTTLERNEERIEHMKGEIRKVEELGLECRFEYGVDGSEIEISDTPWPYIKQLGYRDETIFHDSRRLTRRFPMSKGELGCAWSHLNLYRTLLDDESLDHYLILEDDGELVRPGDLRSALEGLPPEFDLAHLGISHWYPLSKAERVNDRFWRLERRPFSNAGSYLVSRTGARKLLNFSHPSIVFPADDLLSRTFLETLDFAVVVPENNLYNFFVERIHPHRKAYVVAEPFIVQVPGWSDVEEREKWVGFHWPKTGERFFVP